MISWGDGLAVALCGIASQIRQFPVDEVPVPLRPRVETSHSRGGDHLINLLGGQDAPLARRHHLHDVGAQTAYCLRQLRTSTRRALRTTLALMQTIVSLTIDAFPCTEAVSCMLQRLDRSATAFKRVSECQVASNSTRWRH